MSKPITQRGKIALEYVAKHTDLPSRTIARILFDKYPAIYKDIEDARCAVRVHRGTNGKYLRERTKDKQYYGTGRIAGVIPEESADYKPVIINKCKSVGVISDLHIPNHRTTPIDISLDKFAEKNIDTLVINGDLLDNTPFTKHDCKPPNISDVKKWFDKCERFLEFLRDTFPDVRIIWTEGNHDHWYQKWMYRHAAMLSDDPYFTLQERLHLSEYKIEFVDEKKFIMVGKLAITHGHHLIKGLFMPVNGARGVYLRAKKSCMIGHVHTSSQHTETDLHGDIVTTWTTGCLCTLTPDYQPMGGKAGHGFAHVFVDKDNDFNVTNYNIHKGKLLNNS